MANQLFGDVFWTIRLDDEHFRISEDGRKASLDVRNQLEFDRVIFLGTANIPTRLSFHIDYTREAGPPTVVRPIPNPAGYDAQQWAGLAWNASAKGTFSAAYEDGSAAWTGTIDSAGAPGQVPNGIALPFGHMGFEANGAFLTEEHDE